MTNKLSDLYLKIVAFNEVLDVYKNYHQQYCKGTLPSSQFYQYFWQLRTLLIVYCKYFRYYYRAQHITINLPHKILLQAKKDGLIKDADIWLEYIKDLHICLTKNKRVRLKYMEEIINKYGDKTDSMLEFMHSSSNNNFILEKKAQYEAILSGLKELSDNLPIYTHEELLISERSYDILLDYFKSESAIKTVWLHGSKVKGTSNPYSDLDLIIDCDMCYAKKISGSIHKLLIPYYIDITYLHDKKKQRMLAFAAHFGSKKIYNATDFQIYWTKTSNTNPYKFNFDINQIMH